MAGIYQATAFFECNGKGWSESYYRESGSITTLEGLSVFDKPLWEKRALCLGIPCQLFARRVSFVDVKGDSLTVFETLPTSQFDAASPDIALLQKCTSTVLGKNKLVFLRGIADDAEVNGGQINTGASGAAFIGVMNAFTNYLKEIPYGWLGVGSKVEFKLLDYTQNLDGTVNVVGEAGSYGAGPWPAPIQVRFKKANGPYKSQLNQRLVVQPTSGTSADTIAAIAVLPHVATNAGRIVRWTPTLYPINNVFHIKIGERKTGKVYGVPRGRVPNRARI